MHDRFKRRLDEFSDHAVRAIKAEIQTGHTFARIALDSRDPQKTARNAANARKAYETACAWAKNDVLSDSESKQITAELELLRADLAKLERR